MSRTQHHGRRWVSLVALSFTLLLATASRPKQAECQRAANEDAAEALAPGSDEGEQSGNAEASEARRARPTPLEWWPWTISVPLIVGSLTFNSMVTTTAPQWNSAGPVDRAFAPWTLQSDRARERASTTSDVLLSLTTLFPLVDAVAWPSREPEGSRSRQAYRLLAVDFLAFSLQGMVSLVAKYTTRRARPYNDFCESDPSPSACGSDSAYNSFISGHTALAFTSASLVCAHQRFRGQTPTGLAECGTALAMASVVGGLRIAAGRHYASDVAVGALVGFIAGYVVPRLMYRRMRRRAARDGLFVW